MKLKYAFTALDLDNGKVLVPIGKDSEDYHGILKINTDALEIINLLKDDTTEEKIVQQLAKKYENDEEELTKFVHKSIEVLREQRLIID